MCVSELESLWPFSILGMLYDPDPMCLAFETSLNVSICCWLVTQIEWTGSDMHVIGRLQPTNWGAETGHGGCHSRCRKYSEWHQCTDTALCCHQAGWNMPSKSLLIYTCFVSLTTSNGILFYVLAWISLQVSTLLADLWGTDIGTKRHAWCIGSSPKLLITGGSLLCFPMWTCIPCRLSHWLHHQTHGQEWGIYFFPVHLPDIS